METLLEKLEEECSCQICYVIFQEPKTLPCLHTFCLPCLNQLAERHRADRFVPCPKCRREIPIPDDGTFNTAASSFLHNRLVELLAIKTSSDKNISCGNCKKEMVECSFCFDCSNIYCRPCLDAHAVLKPNHKVRALKDFQTEDYQDFLQRPMLCSEKFHESQPLVFYCNHCQMCLCQLCVVVNQKMHSEHKIVPLDEAAEIRKVSFLNEIKSLEEKKELLDEALHEINRLSTEINENVDFAKAEVEEYSNLLISNIIKQRDASLAELEKVRDSRNVFVAERKINFEKERDQINGALEFGKTLINGKATKDLLRESDIDKHFQDLLNYNRDIMDETKIDTFIKFLPGRETKFLGTQFQQLGKIVTHRSSDQSKSQLFYDAVEETQASLKVFGLSVVTKSSDGEKLYLPTDKVELIVEPAKDVSDIQVTDHKNANYELSFVPRVPGRYQMQVKLNNHDLVGSPVEMNVTEKKITRLCTYTLPGGGEMEPYGVAVSKEGEIAVSDLKDHCIVIFDKTGKFLRKLLQSGSNKEELTLPGGVAFNSRDELVVADLWNHRIQILDKRSGRKIRTFGCFGSLTGQFNDPRGVYVDERDRVIVADRNNNRIQVFDEDGNFLFQFGNKTENLKEPFHCVSLYQDSFFVSDRGNDVIKVYDSDGQFLYLFIGESGEEIGQFQYPRGLVVDGRGNLFVCDSDNHRVQMFTVDGRFIGKTTCELKVPAFAALLDDDKLVVSELWGNRLSVFKLS